MDEVSELILSYIANHGKASNSDIVEGTKLGSGTVSKKIKELLNGGIIQISEKQGRTTYYSLKTNLPSNDENTSKVLIDMSKIKSLDQLRNEIRKATLKHNWSNGYYDLYILMVLITKYTKLRILILGSQGAGKSCCVKAVYPDAESNPLVEMDLHRKDLYEVVNLKESIKVIEQQYRHTWGKEDPRFFDRYRVVPLYRIAPSEFIFRFIPLRMKQPYNVRYGYEPFTIELINFKTANSISADMYHDLYEVLQRLKYFTNDEQACIHAIEELKNKQIASLYSGMACEEETQLSAKQWRIEHKYRSIMKYNILAVNLEELWDNERLWLKPADDLQFMNNAYEILKFAYSLSRNRELAVKETFELLKECISTWTVCRGIYVNPNPVVKKDSCNGYVDSKGVQHNVVHR